MEGRIGAPRRDPRLSAGLGHVGVHVSQALGAHARALDLSESKRDDALRPGMPDCQMVSAAEASTNIAEASGLIVSSVGFARYAEFNRMKTGDIRFRSVIDPAILARQSYAPDRTKRSNRSLPMSLAFFEVRSECGRDVLVPEPIARSGWGRARVRGIAISGALARAVEKSVDVEARPGLRQARWSVDIFRPVADAPLEVSASVIREGRRLRLIDATMEQEGRPVARASALMVANSEAAPGAVWSRPLNFEAPPAGLAPLTTEPRLYFSEDVGWTGSGEQHQNSARKQTWHLPVPIVRGEELTPFQFAASVADVVSVVANWGDRGLEYINAGVTVAFARMPDELELGLAAADRVEADGIAAGSAYLYDRSGVLGLATVTAMANHQHAVDPRRLGRET
ncbi:acyl-CoA thioesterase domain-containing protein [Streptomyces sp. NPDC001027]|uniref:acyl-CoA thioesterase domain-containing protein n=1 Tax=Streptomyces sp. NPDC001027 TaxID=3154771 RepID=UPI00332A3434